MVDFFNLSHIKKDIHKREGNEALLSFNYPFAINQYVQQLMIILVSLLALARAAYIIDSAVDQVFWCGGSVIVTSDDDVVQQQNEAQQHRKVLFVLSNRGVLYRSIDYGFKWENVTSGLIANYTLDNWYKSKDVLQSPADSHTLYLVGVNQSYVTHDCGRSYRKFNDSKLFGFKFNKMAKDQILAFAEKKCNVTLKSCRESYKRQLWVTKDGGQTWAMVLDHVRDASWDKLVHYEMVPDTRIIATHIDELGELLVSFSDDFFKTRRLLDKDAFGFYQTPSYLFILVRPDQFSVGYDLKISPHLGDTYFPQEIILPLDDQSKHTFTVLDVTDSIVYLSVSHSEELSKITNVYMSDGNEFTVSLLGNVRSQDTGHCDFERIKSVKGVYIANIYDYEEIERTKQRRKRISSEREMKLQQKDRLDQYKKSVITYDFGAEWHTLKAPKYDYKGSQITCSGDCSLHLRGRTQTSSLIYSSEESVGIILGTGNTGIYLDSKETNTYLSRDGGHTWFEILNGTYIYEIGDHGGMIVFARSDESTSTAKVTLDEGLTFIDVKMNISLEVENIVTEPSNQEQKFLVYGKLSKEQNESAEGQEFWSKYESIVGVLVPIDLSNFQTRVCRGAENPGAPDSDYEYWMPQNYMQQKCLFGQKIKYQRRKRDAKCKNPDIDKKIVVESCPCTQEDWECDLGYIRKIDGGECVPMTLGFSQQQTQVIKCTGTYMKSQGYRKIPGDDCQGGVYLGPIETPCPDQEVTATINQVKTEPVQDKSPDAISKEQPSQRQKDFQSQRARYDYEESIWEKYQNQFAIGVGLLIVYLLKDQIAIAVSAILSAVRVSKKKQQTKRQNYYPPTEEELQQRRQQDRNKNAKQYEMISRAEEDEEAGL